MKPHIRPSLTFVLLVVSVTYADLVVPGVRRTERADVIHFPGANVPARPRPFPVTLDGVNEPLDDELHLDIDELDITTLNRLNGLSDINDFIAMFNLTLNATEQPQTGPILSTRFGGGNDAPGELAKMANCEPELVTVPLDLPLDPTIVYFPTCVRLEQCGGCCYGPLLTCRPSETRVVKFKVLKTVSGGSSNDEGSARRRGGGRGRRRRRRRQSSASFVEVEATKHTKCECGCRVTEQDCDLAIHNYLEGECACDCKNKDEKMKCEAQSPQKYWDNATCSCYCRRVPQDCSTGQFFSHNSCSCEHLSRSGAGGPTAEVPSPGTTPRRRRKPVRVPLA